VLDQNINSMTEFKQIIGRGTRLREDYQKLYFTIMDFKGATRLFADPELRWRTRGDLRAQARRTHRAAR
jgi:type I site-specific restriction endonuclease